MWRGRCTRRVACCEPRLAGERAASTLRGGIDGRGPELRSLPGARQRSGGVGHAGRRFRFACGPRFPPIGNGLCTVAMRRSSLFRSAAELCFQGRASLPRIRRARLAICGRLAGKGHRRGARQIAPKRRHGRARSGGRALALRKADPTGVSQLPKARGSARLFARGVGARSTAPCGCLAKEAKGPRRDDNPEAASEQPTCEHVR